MSVSWEETWGSKCHLIRRRTPCPPQPSCPYLERHRCVHPEPRCGPGWLSRLHTVPRPPRHSPHCPIFQLMASILPQVHTRLLSATGTFSFQLSLQFASFLFCCDYVSAEGAEIKRCSPLLSPTGGRLLCCWQALSLFYTFASFSNLPSLFLTVYLRCLHVRACHLLLQKYCLLGIFGPF